MKSNLFTFLFCLIVILISSNDLYSQSEFSITDNSIDTLFLPVGESSITTCNTRIFDIGGPNGAYPSSTHSIITIYPEDSCSLVQISGSSYLSYHDKIYVFDGVGIGGTPLDTINGWNGNVPIIKSISGPMTLRFYGNYGGTNGFNLLAQCVTGCKAPIIDTIIPQVNSIFFSWTNCDTTLYDVQYKSDFDTTWNTISNIQNHFFTVNNLAYLTKYQIRIRSHCDTLFSGWNRFFVYTTCPTDVNLPFYEDFYDTITCFTFSVPNKMYFALNNYNADAPYLPIPTKNFVLQYNGSNYGSNSYGYIITPHINNLEKGDEVKYWYYRNGQYELPGNIQIYVNSSPSLSGAVLIQQIPFFTLSAPNVYGSGFYEYKAFVPEDTFSYVIFKTLSSSTEIHYLDNISILKGSFTCPSPTSLAVSNVNTNSLTLNWTEIGTATEWQIEYGPMGFQEGTGTLIANITAKPYNITGLPYNQYLGFRVRSIRQPGDTSNWSSTKVYVPGWIFTKSGINSIASCQLRYFDNGGPHANYSTSSNGTLTFYPANPNAKMAITGSYNLGFLTSLEIYNGTSASGTNLLSTINATNPIISHDGPFTIKFSGGNSNNTGYDLNIFCVDSSCWLPLSIVNQNISHDQVTISWVHYNVNKPVQIFYKPVVETNWSIVNTDTSLSVVLTGLNPNTYYHYKLRSVCGLGDTSSFSNLINFRTECTPITSFYEDFESTPVDSIPSCWNKFNSASTSKVIPTNSFTNSQCLLIRSNSGYGIILPKINNLGDGTHQLRLKMRPNSNTNNYQTLNFGYMTNLNDLNSFVSFQIDSIKSTYFYEYIIVPPTGITGNYIAIRGGSLSSLDLYVDELSWEEIPTCTTPISFVSSNITDQSVDVTWNTYHNSTPLYWEFQYGPAGFTLGNGMTQIFQSDSVAISGLTPNTYYDFYVRAICSSTDTSDWSSKLNVRTNCSVAELPVTESFEFDFENYSCWETAKLNPNALGLEIVSLGSYPQCIPQNGLFMIKYPSFSINPGEYALLFSPRIECNGSKIHISFFQYRDNAFSSSQYAGEGVALFYNSIPSLVGADSIGFVTRQNPVNGWYLADFLLPEGIIGSKYFIFKAISMYGSDQFLDNFQIEFLCPTPSNLNVSSVFTTEATLTWQSNLLNNAFILDYKNVNDTNWTSILNISGNNYHLSNLQQNQTYQVRLRALCDTAGMSSNTNLISFTTLYECTPPIFVQIPDSLITDSTATVLWNHAPFFNQYEVSYKSTADINWIVDTTDQNFYLILNLIPNQQYQVRTKTICTEFNSIQTPNMYFNTKCNSPESFRVVEQSITATSARLEWSRIADETDWILNYKKEIDQNWVPVTTQDTVYQFNNLESNTTYLAKIQSMCGSNGSILSDPISFTTLVLGMEQNIISSCISILPNPTNDYIEISCKKDFCEISRIEIVNTIGETLYTVENSGSLLRVDLSKFSSGLYFVKVNTNFGIWSSKIIKL